MKENFSEIDNIVEIKVDEDKAGTRLDVFCSIAFNDVVNSRNYAQKLIEAGNVSVNGAVPQGHQGFQQKEARSQENDRGYDTALQIGFEGVSEPMPGVLVSLAEATVNAVIEGGEGSACRHHRKAAQQPEEAEENAVGDLGHGDH